MQGPALLKGLEFDLPTLFQDGLTCSGVDVVRSQIVQALMIPPGVVVVDELSDCGSEITQQIVVLQRGAGLRRAMPALDLTLRHRMIRPAPCGPANILNRLLCAAGTGFLLLSHPRSTLRNDEPSLSLENTAVLSVGR